MSVYLNLDLRKLHKKYPIESTLGKYFSYFKKDDELSNVRKYRFVSAFFTPTSIDKENVLLKILNESVENNIWVGIKSGENEIKSIEDLTGNEGFFLIMKQNGSKYLIPTEKLIKKIKDRAREYPW